MKTSIITLACVLGVLSLTHAQDQGSLCKVNMVKNKEVYVMCEPERKYEVIDNVNSAVSQLMDNSKTIKDLVNTLVKKAIRKEKSGEVKPFDAIITQEGDVAFLVKFNDDDVDKKGIGRVATMQDREVYVMSEPLRAFEVIDKVNTAFIQILGIEPSIENLTKALLNKAVEREKKGDIGKFDAIVTAEGNKATVIKYK